SGPMRDGTGWPIGIEAPLIPAFEPGTQLELLLLPSGGVATSGSDYRRWQQGGHWRHHIIDPRNGEPADSDVVAATIVALAASQAEIGAKVALLLGSGKGMEWLEERSSMAGLLVLSDGRILQSSR